MHNRFFLEWMRNNSQYNGHRNVVSHSHTLWHRGWLCETNWNVHCPILYGGKVLNLRRGDEYISMHVQTSRGKVVSGQEAFLTLPSSLPAAADGGLQGKQIVTWIYFLAGHYCRREHKLKESGSAEPTPKLEKAHVQRNTVHQSKLVPNSSIDLSVCLYVCLSVCPL